MNNKQPRLFRISTKDKINFARNLALLLKSGVSLVEALEILKESSSSPSLRFLISSAIEDINKGQFLSSALGKFQGKIDNFFISIVKVGEHTANLSQNLEKIAQELRKIERLKNKIIAALIYPAFIISIMILVVILVIYFLFPRLLPIFQNLKIDLPLPTKIFLTVATFLLNYGHFIFLILLLLFLLFFFLRRYYKFNFYLHYLILKLPFISNLLKKYLLAEFSRNLSLLIESGLPIIEALDLTSESSSNLVYKKFILIIKERISKGHSLSESLQEFSIFFPYNFIQMINIGERTGNLAVTLSYLSDYFEEEIDINIEKMVNSLEPIILLIVAVMVGFIAFSIVLPIYELSDKLSK